MPPSRWTATRWGSASSPSSTCGRCMGTRRRPILPSKASSILARRSTEARRSRSGRNAHGPASARSRRRAWRSASRSPRSCVGRNRPATGSCARTNIRRRGDVGLLKDWNYVEQAVRIPALAELIREALIRALFVRDDRVLPASIIGDLNRLPAVTVKVREDGEVRKLIRVLNGEESTVSLGLNAEDYHFFRTQLGVGRTREFGLTQRARLRPPPCVASPRGRILRPRRDRLAPRGEARRAQDTDVRIRRSREGFDRLGQALAGRTWHPMGPPHRCRRGEDFAAGTGGGIHGPSVPRHDWYRDCRQGESG